ncbi:MAG: hypothetical protein GTO45_03335 [Candidatus Aminicenantes bacterium]|nr:hypothetical protein [Candidatus Aminicenantes bacterium]NIM77759.1 hypothetical protein [Candidatus Aminicenantes bacterium]NIN17072.1 hypothetical protein [Candidatus Aminicenantes bacterium]NIN40965.1 hypothetical protein [Candidatus Aminicenantes bacterium]NIN83770.1 hypothetical protein [Candidatus Aminicenantes bacterium]
MGKQTSEAVLPETNGELRGLNIGYGESTSTLGEVNSQPEEREIAIHIHKKGNQGKRNPDESRENITESIQEERV